jgi:hypothetical protein
LVHRAGVQDPAILVAVGRLVVVAFSVANIWLTFRVSVRFFKSIPIALLAATCLSLIKLQNIAGSTELPRTVEAFFLLLAFDSLLADGAKTGRAFLSGVLLGVAACMRFSEVIFVAPAAIQLILRRRWRDACIFGAGFALVAYFVLGPLDELYWGQSFYSLRHFADYTLLQRLSSRGYQPFYEYVRAIPAWSDPLFFALAFAAILWTSLTLSLWTWLPVILLSMLPHKEPRYLVPVLPFMSMSAAASLWRISEWLARPETEADGAVRRRRIAGGLTAAVAAAAILEIAGGWFPRSEDGIVLAKYVASRPVAGTMVAEQSWRIGGRLYLGDRVRLVDLDPGAINEPQPFSAILRDPEIAWIALFTSDVRRLSSAPVLEHAAFAEERRFGEYTLYRHK